MHYFFSTLLCLYELRSILPKSRNREKIILWDVRKWHTIVDFSLKSKYVWYYHTLHLTSSILRYSLPFHGLIAYNLAPPFIEQNQHPYYRGLISRLTMRYTWNCVPLHVIALSTLYFSRGMIWMHTINAARTHLCASSEPTDFHSTAVSLSTSTLIREQGSH